MLKFLIFQLVENNKYNFKNTVRALLIVVVIKNCCFLKEQIRIIDR